MKYKAGQKVKVINRINGHKFQLNEVVTIIIVSDSSYTCGNNTDKWNLTEDEVELFEKEPIMENSTQLITPILDYKGKCKTELTKREYFAGLAMQGLLNNYVAHGMYGNHESYPIVAEQSVMLADELLKQLEK